MGALGLSRLLVLSVLLATSCGGADQDARVSPGRAGGPTPAPTAPPVATAAAAASPAPAPAPVAPPTADAGAAAPRPNTGPVEPRVSAERLEVVGPLPEVVVVRILRAHRAQVQYCYEQALRTDPALAGRAVLRMTIGADGAVSEAAIAESTIGPVADACLVHAMRGWRFPQPTGAQPVRVTQPFSFAVADVAPDAPPGTIAWTLTVQPARVRLARLRDVTIRISARNRGNTTVDPGRHPLAFTIDAEPSMALDMGFGNGAMERAWIQLPPGQTVLDERIGFDGLVSAAGRHVIVMSKDGTELARAVLDVRP